jgi:hypothetical protein
MQIGTLLGVAYSSPWRRVADYDTAYIYFAFVIAGLVVMYRRDSIERRQFAYALSETADKERREQLLNDSEWAAVPVRVRGLRSWLRRSCL